MRILAVLGVAVLAAGAGARQQPVPPPQPAQQPSFRVSTDVVAVDVAVIASDSTPVRGLQQADFTVRVDGQARRIVSLQFIDQAAGGEASRAAPSAAIVPLTRVSSNQGSGAGRLVVILVDQNRIPFGQLRVAAKSVDQLLAAFGPSDRIALATLPGPRTVENFTGDHRRIVDAIGKIPGMGGRFAEGRYELGYAEALKIDRDDRATLDEVVNRECTEVRNAAGGDLAGKQASLDACVQRLRGQASQMVAETRQENLRFAADLRRLLAALGTVEGPKLLVLLSTGFIATDALDDFAFVSRESAAARTAIYGVRLNRALFDVAEMRGNVDLFSDSEAALSGLEGIAGRGRGRVVDVTGSASIPFARLAREMSGYYLIGIETTSADRDGKTHKIAVETSRPGVTVRARPEFAFTPPRASGAGAAAADDLATVDKMLSAPLTTAALPLRVATFNLADENSGKVRVMIAAEVDRDQAKADSVAVGYAALDAQGRATAGFSRRVPLEKAPSGALAFVSVVSVRPGKYTLKLAAVHGGRGGSVEHPFTAAVTAAGSLQLGDLIVGDPLPGQGKMISPSLEPRVQGDRIWSFVQLGGDAAAYRDVRLALDILKREDGPSLLSAPLTMEEAGKRLRAAEANFDARLLPPGDYIARLTVTESGKPLGAISSAFAFERRRPAAPRAAAGRGAERFNPQEVLEPAVLGPFLEELAANAPADSQAAIALAKAGRFQAAVQELKPGTASGAVGPFIRGLALFSSAQLQPASEAFRQAIAAAPDFMAGAFYIGACYAAGGKEQQAVNAWQTSLVGLDRYPIVYRVLADGLMRAGQAARAAELLNEAQARWPEDDALGMRLARASVDSGRYDQAAAALERLIARQPGNADLLFLAMQSAFESAIDAAPAALDSLLAALKRYRDMYTAANGPRQALVSEWVSYVESRAKAASH